MTIVNDPKEIEIIADVMKKRDILLNMAYAERRKQEAAKTADLIRPQKVRLPLWFRMTVGAGEIVVGGWIIFGILLFLCKALELMFQ